MSLFNWAKFVTYLGLFWSHDLPCAGRDTAGNLGKQWCELNFARTVSFVPLAIVGWPFRRCSRGV